MRYLGAPRPYKEAHIGKIRHKQCSAFYLCIASLLYSLIATNDIFNDHSFTRFQPDEIGTRGDIPRFPFHGKGTGWKTSLPEYRRNPSVAVQNFKWNSGRGFDGIVYQKSLMKRIGEVSLNSGLKTRCMGGSFPGPAHPFRIKKASAYSRAIIESMSADQQTEPAAMRNRNRKQDFRSGVNKKFLIWLRWMPAESARCKLSSAKG